MARLDVAIRAAAHAGYDVSIDDLKAFRQLGSKTTGRGFPSAGVEATTGVEGRLACLADFAAGTKSPTTRRRNRDGHTLVDHRTWAF